MRILLFAYEYPPLGGGVANAVFHLLKEWGKQEDIEVLCVTSSLQNSWEVEKVTDSVTLYRVPIGKREPADYHSQKLLHMLRYVLGTLWIGLRVWHEKKPNVSLSFGYPGPVASWLLSWLGLPYVVALRGVDVPGYNPRFSWGARVHQVVARILWQRAKTLTANSKWLANLARKTWREAKIEIIPNGVDTELFRPVPAEKKFPAFTVTAGGTVMGKKKRLDLLIHGFSLFVKKEGLSPKQAQLLLIGDGDERDSLEELSKELSVEGYVRFVGAKNKDWIARNLPRCHVFCLPSIAEGMSNAALEAMACGLPLILSDVGAAKDMIISEENGFILERIDMDRLAFVLSSYFTKRGLYTPTVDVKKSQVIHSWGRIADEMVKLLVA